MSRSGRGLKQDLSLATYERFPGHTIRPSRGVHVTDGRRQAISCRPGGSDGRTSYSISVTSSRPLSGCLCVSLQPTSTENRTSGAGRENTTIGPSHQSFPHAADEAKPTTRSTAGDRPRRPSPAGHDALRSRGTKPGARRARASTRRSPPLAFPSASRARGRVPPVAAVPRSPPPKYRLPDHGTAWDGRGGAPGRSRL